MPHPSPTRERIVDRAAELFHRRGVHGTSLADVQRAADVRPGSLYHFFKSKEELVCAALERYAELLDPMVMAPAFAETPDPLERVLAVLGRYRQLLLETDFELGCPIGNLAVELAPAGPEVRRRLDADFDLWAAAIEECLRAAGDRLPPEVDPRRLSRFVLTTMEGAVLVARGRRQIAPLDDAIAHLGDYLRRLTDGRDVRGGSEEER